MTIAQQIHQEGRREGMDLGMLQGVKKGREEGMGLGMLQGVKKGREEGMGLGVKKGREEGIEEGRKKTSEAIKHIAMRLLQQRQSKKIVAQVTGLSFEDLAELMKEKQN